MNPTYTIHYTGGVMDGKTEEDEFVGRERWVWVVGENKRQVYKYTSLDTEKRVLQAEFVKEVQLP